MAARRSISRWPATSGSGEAKKLLEWHCEKAGLIEAVPDVVRNELAGGVMPCARFGANAAWLRLALLTHNVLTALKRIGLPEPWLRARPKWLRFQIFCSAGRLVHHARRVLLRVHRWREQLAEWLEVWRLLPVSACPYGRIIGGIFRKYPECLTTAAQRARRVGSPVKNTGIGRPDQ
jgi:hypothetical protein